MSKIKVINGGHGWKTKTAGGTIAEGDLVYINGTSGKVIVSTTSGSIKHYGIALNDAVADGTVKVELISSNTLLEFPVESGTAAATSEGDFADLASPDGLTLTVTNSDVYITTFVDAATVQGHVARSARN